MLIIFLLFYEPSAMFIIFSLKSIKKQLLDLVYGFLHLKCIIIKQLLDEVFVICQIINVEVRVISLAFGSWERGCWYSNSYYLDIDNSAYHKNFIEQLFI